MKKIIFVLITLILISSVFAIADKAIEKQEQVKIVGLENAIMKVRSNETKVHLEAVLNNITAKSALQTLKKLEFREENGQVIAEGLKMKKFLGLFKVDRKIIYHISETGELTRKGRFLDLLFREE